jgi:RNA polymerase sigma-70 factor (ECF subfamily)
MSDHIDSSFIRMINTHIGIAVKISRVYGQNLEEREDLLQEMMYQLWRSFSGFDHRSKFSTWMYRVCLNTALTFKRKTLQGKVESLSLEHYEIPDQAIENREEAIAMLYKAIATLTPLNKAVIMLSLEELSYEEIAQITGLSRSNVSVRLVRIKKELEKLLKTDLST